MAVTDIPEHERPLSEQFRVIAKQWADAEAAAQLLEDTKSAVLAQKIAEQGDMPHNKAENNVKASEDWRDHIARIVEARKEANLKKLHLEYIRMRFSEAQSMDANARAERRLAR